MKRRGTGEKYEGRNLPSGENPLFLNSRGGLPSHKYIQET